MLKVKKKNQTVTFQVFLFYLTALMLTSEFLTIYNVLMPGFLRTAVNFGWLFCAVLFLMKKNAKSAFLNLIPATLLLIFFAIKLVLGGNFEFGFYMPINAFFQVYNIFFTVMLAHVVIHFTNWQKRKLFYYVVIILTLTVIPSMIHLISDPNIIRYQREGFALINMTILHALVPMVGIVFFLILQKRGNAKIWFLFALGTIVLFMANFTIALSMLLFCFLCVIVLRFAKKTKKVVALFAIVIISVFVLRIPIALFIEEVSRLPLFSPITQARMIDIANLLRTGYLGRAFTNRFVLQDLSIDSFLANPLFGISFRDYGEATLGLHETWFTFAAIGGIFGLLLLLWTLVHMTKDVSKSIKSRRAKQVFWLMILVVFVFSFANPMFSKSTLFGLFAIIPCVDAVLRTKKVSLCSFVIKKKKIIRIKKRPSNIVAKVKEASFS